MHRVGGMVLSIFTFLAYVSFVFRKVRWRSVTSQVISQGSGACQDGSQGSGGSQGSEASQGISHGSGVGQDIGKGSGEGLNSPHLFPAAIDSDKRANSAFTYQEFPHCILFSHVC